MMPKTPTAALAETADKSEEFAVIAGSRSSGLSAGIAEELGVTPARITVGTYSDGETMVEINENMRGRDVFVVQSTSCPGSDSLFELALIMDALRRASAGAITAVIPYFGYSRQDRRPRSARVPISAKVAADLISVTGAARVLSLDLHSEQLQGFFTIPVDNVYCTHMFSEDIKANILDKHSAESITVVSPDTGGVVRARALAQRLPGSQLALIDKRRSGPNQIAEMNVIGDVKDRVCIVVDDIIDTGGTMARAAAELHEQGAREIHTYCTHAVLSGNGAQQMINSHVNNLVVTNSIDSTSELSHNKIRVLDVSPWLGRAIKRLRSHKSLRQLFTSQSI